MDPAPVETTVKTVPLTILKVFALEENLHRGLPAGDSPDRGVTALREIRVTPHQAATFRA
jgi:hypothetical protein